MDDAPDQQASADVYEERYQEKHESCLDQSGAIELRGRLTELARDCACDRMRWLEQRGADLEAVADDESDRHRFADRPAQPQIYAADDPRARVRDDRARGRLPARRPKGQHCLP